MADGGKAQPTPFVELPDALPRAARDDLATSLANQLDRSGVAIGIGSTPGAEAYRLDLGEHRRTLSDGLRHLGAVLRRELDLPHFVIEAIPLQVTIRGPGGSCSTTVSPGTARGTRRVELLYTIVLGDGGDGGTVRLFDTLRRGDVDAAADTYTEVTRVDNSLLCFRSDRHHEIAMPNDQRALVCSVSGWMVGDPVPTRAPAVGRETLYELQVRYLPRITGRGFEVRPIPEGVHRLLSGLLALRGPRARPEGADRGYHDGTDPEIVPVDDVADEVLARLRPLHEEWCGTRLVPTNAYGLRRYRAGSRLTMHVDRLSTHVVSSVLQIAQDVDVPWPIQLDVDGRRDEIVLEAGQMLLYEGATTPHGRVTPLEGREFVNLFLHYRPTDWDWSAESITALALADGAIDRAGRRRR
jgi:hypothetical protein